MTSKRNTRLARNSDQHSLPTKFSASKTQPLSSFTATLTRGVPLNPNHCNTYKIPHLFLFPHAKSARFAVPRCGTTPNYICPHTLTRLSPATTFAFTRLQKLRCSFLTLNIISLSFGTSSDPVARSNSTIGMISVGNTVLTRRSTGLVLKRI